MYRAVGDILALGSRGRQVTDVDLSRLQRSEILCSQRNVCRSQFPFDPLFSEVDVVTPLPFRFLRDVGSSMGTERMSDDEQNENRKGLTYSTFQTVHGGYSSCSPGILGLSETKRNQHGH